MCDCVSMVPVRDDLIHTCRNRNLCHMLENPVVSVLKWFLCISSLFIDSLQRQGGAVLFPSTNTDSFFELHSALCKYIH